MTDDPPTDHAGAGDDSTGGGPDGSDGGDGGDAHHDGATGADRPGDRRGGRDRPVPDRVRVESGGPPSEAVLRAVEAAAGVDLSESDERLGDVVDTDALDALFGPATAGPDDPGRVEFAFCGCVVTVESDGSVHVTPGDAG